MSGRSSAAWIGEAVPAPSASKAMPRLLGRDTPRVNPTWPKRVNPVRTEECRGLTHEDIGYTYMKRYR